MTHDADVGKTRSRTGPASGGRPERATLEMVARRAGVSPSTVSRILNGTAVVSELKRAAVAAAIAELGFVPDPLARALAGGRTRSIGVVTLALDSPFYSLAMRGVEDELGRADYSPLFISGHFDAAREARCIEMLRARRVDGIILLDSRLGAAELRAQAGTLPFVVTGRRMKAANLIALQADNLHGGRLATGHLLALGHRRIAYVAGYAHHPDASDRLAGHRRALAAADVAFDPSLVVPGEFTEPSGRDATLALLERGTPFDAIVAANDQMAIGAMLALHRRGLRVPADVSVVGYDDIAAAAYTIPPLTTVRQSGYEAGTLSAVAMLRLLGGERGAPDWPAPQIVVRESTSAPSRGPDGRGSDPHQPSLPGSPLNGPVSSGVIQPP